MMEFMFLWNYYHPDHLQFLILIYLLGQDEIPKKK